MDTSHKINWDINWEDEKSAVLLNPRSSPEENQKLQQLAEQFPQKAHLWIASSGSSTGSNKSVKLIALSKNAFLASAKGVNQHLESTGKDVWIQALPRFHVGGLSIETRAHLSGAAVVPGILGEKWDAQTFIDIANDQKASLSALVPTQIFDLVQTGRKAPFSLRAIVIGGSALSQDVREQALGLGWPLLPSYGLTECCSQVATVELNLWSDAKAPLKVLSHVQVRTNSDGILQVRSPALLSGFAQWVDGEMHWTDPKNDGWYQTEDLCELNGEFLRPLGRGSDYVKISGEGVNLRNLQEALETLSQKKTPELWSQLAISTAQDPRLGAQLILARTEKVPAALALEIRDEFNQTVAPYERIKKMELVAEIPRTALGKIAREKLKILIAKAES